MRLTRLQALVLLDFSRMSPPPTLKDLCYLYGWASSHTAWLVVDALERKGLLERDGVRARGVRLTDAGRHFIAFELPPPALLRPSLCRCGATFFSEACPFCSPALDRAVSDR